MLNKVAVRNKRFLPFYEKVDKGLSERQKFITFAMTAVLKMINGILLAQSESGSLVLRKIMSDAVDLIILIGEAHM